MVDYSLKKVVFEYLLRRRIRSYEFQDKGLLTDDQVVAHEELVLSDFDLPILSYLNGLPHKPFVLFSYILLLFQPFVHT